MSQYGRSPYGLFRYGSVSGKSIDHKASVAVRESFQSSFEASAFFVDRIEKSITASVVVWDTHGLNHEASVSISEKDLEKSFNASIQVVEQFTQGHAASVYIKGRSEVQHLADCYITTPFMQSIFANTCVMTECSTEHAGSVLVQAQGLGVSYFSTAAIKEENETLYQASLVVTGSYDRIHRASTAVKGTGMVAYSGSTAVVQSGAKLCMASATVFEQAQKSVQASVFVLDIGLATDLWNTKVRILNSDEPKKVRIF